MTTEEPIAKKILHTGTKNVVFTPGTKVVFHFKTNKCDDSQTVIDDSKILGKPMELILGKKFKLEVWEAIVQKMALNEVACFRVHKSLVTPYPFVSKTLREVDKPRDEKKQHHFCGSALQHGIGYEDLDKLIKNPEDLEFTIELLQVVPPEDYKKDSWQMTSEEKLENVPSMREKGNALFREKRYEEAEEIYRQAIGWLEQLMLAEKPNDVEWNKLNEMKIPLLLNFSQCKLQKKEYYEVIEHCTTILKCDSDNVKALYRRGKAHIGAWNEKEAISDLTRAAELDPQLKNTVEKELKSFFQAIKEKENTQKKRLTNIFT